MSVIRACIEALHSVINVIARGEHQHRQMRQALTNPTQDHKTIHCDTSYRGQAQVKDHTVNLGGFEKQLRLCTIAGRVHRMARKLELCTQAVAQQFVVFHQE